MSVQESFEWVALPAGMAPDGQCRVSVFVAPKVMRADEPARTLRLDELPALADWPATLARIEFSIELDGAPPVPATRVSPPAGSALWRRLFPGTTSVHPFVPDDPTVHTMVEYDSTEVLDVIESGYAAAAPLEPPVEDHYDPGYWAPEDWMPELDQPPEAPEPGPEPGRGLGPEPGRGPGGGELVEPTEPDPWSIRNLFPVLHEVVSTPDNSWLHGIGGNAENLISNATFVAGERREIPLGDGMRHNSGAALQAAKFADSLRLAWDQLPPLPSERLEPVTPVEPTEPVETIEPIGPEGPTLAEQQAALVASYDLHRILAALGDHPALLRTLGLVVDLQVPLTVPDQGRIRAVVRRADDVPGADDRTPWVAVTGTAPGGFAARSATDDVAPPGLEALDGYRVVQLDLEGTGIKLLERAAEETRPGNSAPRDLPALRTVGLRLVERGAAEKLINRGVHVNELRNGTPDDTLDADDVQRGYRLDVFDEATGHWYPLHARRAHYTAADGTLLGPVTDEGSFTGAFTGRPLPPGETLDVGDIISVDEALVTWDGWSLAAPRPGKMISADPRETDPVHAGDDLLTSTGLRIATTPLPGSLPRLRFGHTYRMRMRSVDLAGNALTVAQATAAAAPGSAAVTAPVTFRRFERVPPPVPAFGPDPDELPRPGESEQRLAVRSSLDPDDTTFGATPGTGERLLFAPECSVALAEWHGVFDDAVTADGSAAARAEAYRRAGREAGTLTPGTSELPWLPDPLSAGVCLSGLPGMAPEAILTLAWPSTPAGPGPIRLRLVGTDEDVPRTPTVDAAAGLVTVFLPPGGRATAEVSSVLADPTVMALPELWRERLDPAALAVAQARMARHRHGMITPSLPIELVHATQRPHLAPAPAGPMERPQRQPEQTDARINAPWQIHAPTTGTVELLASWTLPTDEPVLAASPAPGGTRWVARGETVTTVMGKPVVVPPDAPATATVTVGDTPDAATSGTGATIDFGTTASVRLRLRAVATSRFAEFFPPEYGPAPPTADAPARPSRLTIASDEVEVLVEATRRPPAPTVLETMPLVVRSHEPGPSPESGIVLREGGWLRIWLARPWFVTGWDEVPAVVATADNQPLLTEELNYQISTLVAPDPARGAPVFTGITPRALGDFPVGWSIVEPADASAERAIGVMDGPIDWDPDRGAWFTDIRIKAPLYFPFVRLALARHQPHAIRGAQRADEFRVSPVVTMDPIQVLPDRRLRHRATATGVEVSLEGRSYDTAVMPVNHGDADFPDWIMQPLPGGAPSQARVIAQRRIRTGGDDLLAWQDLFERPMNPALSAEPGTLQASLTLPFDPTNPPGEYRLLVIEQDFTHGPAILGTPEETRARTTYAEVIPLSRPVAPPP